MAGVCSYNFTVGFGSKNPAIRNDGQNKITDKVGDLYDSFFGYKNQR